MFPLVRLLFIFVIFVLNCSLVRLEDLTARVWGPGLRPDVITMPARYFFVEFLKNGTSLGKSPGKVLKAKVFGEADQRRCQIWTEMLDRGDGSFIVRYKLYETCYNLKIHITYERKHLGDSPYSFDDPVYSDDCPCPLNDLNEWVKQYECDSYDQIAEDLKPFSKVNMTAIKEEALSRFNNPSSNSICHYAVVDNEVYRKCYGKYVGFNMFSDNILLSLTRKVKLPDMELIINLGDWPLSSHNLEPLPIFSWCGSEDTYDIVMPTYDITESSLENMGKVSLDMLSVQANSNLEWKERKSKAFFRGRDSNRARLRLIEISREHPDLFNVSLTNFFFFRDQQEKYGPKAEHVSFYEFFKYKYQLGIDGTVASYRFPYLLAGGSLVFKQRSKYYEWFYHKLKQGVHYVDLREDLSNLVDKLHWALDHDDEAQHIGQTGANFARNNLLPKHVFCYHGALLKEWSARLDNKVVISEGMEHVEQVTPKATCFCERTQTYIHDDL